MAGDSPALAGVLDADDCHGEVRVRHFSGLLPNGVEATVPEPAQTAWNMTDCLLRTSPELEEASAAATSPC